MLDALSLFIDLVLAFYYTYVANTPSNFVEEQKKLTESLITSNFNEMGFKLLT
jgi:hypothetical protein